MLVVRGKRAGFSRIDVVEYIEDSVCNREIWEQVLMATRRRRFQSEGQGLACSERRSGGNGPDD
jgi:hypothetical protein